MASLDSPSYYNIKKGKGTLDFVRKYEFPYEIRVQKVQ